MAENSRSGLFLFSLLQLITLGCLIFVIANNKYELKSVQAELKQMQEEKIKSRSENVLGENADSYQSKMHMKSVHLNKRSAQQYESVSSMLFDALSVWFGGSPIQPVIKCTVDQSNQTKCSFHSASQEENEAAHAAAVLMEEAISRVFEERMEANLNSSSEDLGCAAGNHDCEQICQDNGTSYTCSCEVGFEINSDGKTCRGVDCGTPPLIDNGSPGTPTSTTFGGTLTYTCNSGYIPSGSPTVSCLASGDWSSPLNCTPAVNCGTPPSISNAYTGTPTSTTIGGTVTYSCNYKYRLVGSDTVSCLESGFWSFPRPWCDEITCGRPPTIVGGSPYYSPSTTSIGGSVSYRCDSGYERISGSGVARCGIGGTWYIIPRCSDINECSSYRNRCDHNCHNNDGSYTCSCRSGYDLQSDGRSCSRRCFVSGTRVICTG